MSEETSYHSPIDLAERKGRRHVRAGRAAPDFMFATPIVKQKVVPLRSLADAEHERQMAKVRTLSAIKRPRWLARLAWYGTPLACVGAAAAFYLR
jgi:hypothetical protein